jgi:hypothetical protein
MDEIDGCLSVREIRRISINAWNPEGSLKVAEARPEVAECSLV